MMQLFTNGTEIMMTAIPSVIMTTTPENCEDYLSKVKRGGRIWVLVLYCIYFIFGVFGNAILVLLFIMTKKLRTMNNALLTNLAFSDFLFVILYIPIKFFEEWSVFRPFGKTFCYISVLINYTSQDVSTMSMTALSYMRYRAVMRPLHIRQNERKLEWYIPIWCGISWIVGITAAIFPAVHCKEITHRCLLWDRHYVDSFTNNTNHLTFHIVRFSLFYLLPLLIITSFYSIMAFTLCKTPSSLRRNDSSSAIRATRSRKKLGGIVLAIVVIFFLSWLPNYLGWFTGLDDNQFIQELTDTRALCMFVPASLNPVILFVTSSAYRRPLLQVFSPWHRSGRRVVRRLRSSSLTTSLSSLRLPRLSRFSWRSSSTVSSPTGTQFVEFGPGPGGQRNSNLSNGSNCHA